MKNGLLIWNVILTLGLGFLIIKQFGSKKGNHSVVNQKGDDSLRTNSQFRIAYFEMDSVASKWNMAKDLQIEMRNKEDNINSEMANRSKALQQKYNYFQNLDQAGNLSDAQKEAAGLELKKMDDEMKNRKQQLDQDYNNYMMTKQNEIKTKMEDYMKEYNKTKNYSYIVSYEQGLFYFKDTAYNITSDVVKGLNEKYKPSKKN